MNKFHKAIQIIYITPAFFFVLLFVYSIFSKFLGLASIASELFGVLFTVFFPTIPFIAAFVTKNTYKRIAYVIWGCVLVYVFVFSWKTPQIMTTRFYYQAKNQTTIANLDSSDVSYITIDKIILTQPEQIIPIVETLNESTWYSPNHERRGKQVSMIIVLQTGEALYFHISRFYDEDSADILFIRPHESGFWADGNAYVPNLPSVLEKIGYTLSKDY